MKPNIVGSIHATDPPKTAQFCKLNPSGDFIELFYRLVPTKFNDGTTQDMLEYWSNFDCWRPTNERDTEQFLKTREFHEII